MSFHDDSGLRTLVELGPKTDYAISPLWVLGAAGNWVIWAVAPFILYFERLDETLLATSRGIFGLAGLLFSSASSYLVYLLVNRRNNHLARDETLLWEAAQSIKARSLETDMKTRMPLSSAEQTFARLSETKERSALLWALLTLLPYIGWIFMIYVLAFLSGDLETHERQEDMVLEDFDRALSAQGKAQALPRRIVRGGRSIAAYVALSLLTMAIFSIGWLYLMVKDPEPHFLYHHHFEDALVQPIIQGAVETMEGTL